MKSIRHVLFISVDQWRGDCLSILGHPQVKTPQIDRLASEGLLARRHFAQAAPCGPSRASLLTGLYPMNHRSVTNGTPLDRRHTNIALEVRRAGYDPILFGYTDTSADPRGLSLQDPTLRDYSGILPGFREGFSYDHEVNLSWLAALRRHGYTLPEEGYDAYLPAPGTPAPEGFGSTAAPPRYRAEHSDSAFTTDRVIDYLQGRGQEPWFVHAVYFRPHPPLHVPPPYNTLYSPAAVPAPRRLPTLAQQRRQHPFLDYWLDHQSRPGYFAGYPDCVVTASSFEQRQLRASYYGLITEADHQIGRLLDFLRRSPGWDETLVIVTSDHGEQLGDQWCWGKGGYFDASYHVPLILRIPGQPQWQGQVWDTFTESVDLLPTILEALGLPLPAALDGRSLQAQIRDPALRRSMVHWEYDFRDPARRKAEQALGLASEDCTLNVVRDHRFKLVHFTGLPPLLFDLVQDPGETTNLAGDPSWQPVLLELTQRLLSLRMRHADRSLTGVRILPEGLQGDVSRLR